MLGENLAWERARFNAALPMHSCWALKTPMRFFAPFTPGKELRPANGGLEMGPPRPKRYVEMGSRKKAEKKKRKPGKDNSRTAIYEKSSEVFHHARVHGGCPFYFGNRTGD